MPVLTTYPGVYIEEISSGVHTITGVATSITAFLGRSSRGPVNEPTILNSFGDFERFFGELDPNYPAAYAVQDFFANGGGQALFVRAYHPLFPDDATRTTAIALAKAAADAVALTATNSTGATALLVAADVNAYIALNPPPPVIGTPNTPARAAAQAVVDAANAEAQRSPYVTTTQHLIISSSVTGGTIKLKSGAGETNPISGLLGTTSSAEAALKSALTTDLPSVFSNTTTVARTQTSSGDYDFKIVTTAPALSPQPLIVSENLLLPSSPNSATIVAPLPDAASVASAASAAAGSPGNSPAVTAATPLNTARFTFANGLALAAANPGAWGNSLELTVDYNTKPLDNGTPDPTLFNLTVTDPIGGGSEQLRNISFDPTAVRWVSRVLANESSLLTVVGTPPLSRPALGTIGVDSNGAAADSQPLIAADFLGQLSDKTGMYALENADLFNLLCIPPDTRDGDTPVSVYQDALTYCTTRRAMLIVDSPAAWGANPNTAAAAAIAGLSSLGLNGPATRNAMLVFPRILKADLARNSQIDTFVACGAVAGICARTDGTRGVWKAPAGVDAAVYGVVGLQATLSDPENGQLNPLAINCLRTFPLVGPTVWGARTLRGADAIADEYKYIPVRRTALFLEETLYRATKWVVFEPNDEPLWAQIRLNIGAFMQTLFRQGAFQGTSPKQAYLVKCDNETTTQDDVDRGVVNILVGFAPLKPAEFVIVQIQQLAGQLAA